MANNSEIRTLAFRLSSEANASAAYVAHPFWVLSLPEPLKRAIRETLALALDRNAEETRLPISVLNKVVRLLLPDVTGILTDADRAGNRPWLYATVYPEDKQREPANRTAMRRILAAWIREALHPKVNQQSREDLVKQIVERDLTWQYEQMNLTSWTTADNKTARPYVKDSPYNGFVLLPDVAAARIASKSFTWGSQTLTFRRAPRNPGRSGTELISWPPLYLEGEEWPSSVVLTLTLQTVPFQSFPELHCDISMRRWLGTPTRIRGKAETSIYLLDSVPWIEGTQHSHCFQVAPAAWEYLPPEKRDSSGEEFAFSWSSDLAALLNRLHPVTPLPSPQHIRDNPQQYIRRSQKRGSSELEAAIVYRPSMVPSHKIGTGMMPRDRYGFTEQLAAALEPELVFTPAYQRLIGIQKHANPFFPTTSTKKKSLQEMGEKEALAQLQMERRLTLGRGAAQVTIEIWWQSTEILQALRQAIQELFGYPLDKENGFVLATPEVSLTVQSQPLGVFGAALQVASGSREMFYDRYRDALIERVERFTASADIPAIRGRVLTVVELAGAEAFRDNDPKPAIKIGFGKKVRMVQNITPLPADMDDLPPFVQEQERNALPERAKAAIRDLVRQAGVLGSLPKIQSLASQKGKQGVELHVPEPLHYLGVWMIKQYRKSSATHLATRLPVVVHMASNSYSVQVIAPGFRDWMTYSDASLALLNGQGRSVQKPEEFHRFLRETFSRCLLPFGDTILFCDAHNLRSQWWQWLQNEHITQALPPFFEQFPKVRIVRVRKGIQELPEWFAREEMKQYGLSQGVFALKENNHVFACVQAKPATAKQSNQTSKVSSRTKEKRTGELVKVDPEPGSYAWNPGIVEMTVSCADASDAFMSAVVGNELRAQFAPQSAAPTLLPLPLHLASLLDEYVLPLRKGQQVYTATSEIVEDEQDE